MAGVCVAVAGVWYASRDLSSTMQNCQIAWVVWSNAELHSRRKSFDATHDYLPTNSYITPSQGKTHQSRQSGSGCWRCRACAIVRLSGRDQRAIFESRAVMTDSDNDTAINTILHDEMIQRTSRADRPSRYLNRIAAENLHSPKWSSAPYSTMRSTPSTRPTRAESARS